MSSTELETPMALPLRLWLGVEVFFGLAAISAVFLRPQHTATNFAWPIKPDVMAAVLGAFYVATALLFVLPLFMSHWQSVRVVILPAVAFTTTMLVVTFLHWDKFSTDSFPFYLWFASYLLPPPIFTALYVWHQRRSAPVGAGIEVPLPAWARTLFRGNGLALMALGLLGFTAPSVVDGSIPWAVTPLTARTLSGWLFVVGMLHLGVALEGDWRRSRLATAMVLVLPVALVVQLARFSDQVDWGAPALWAVLGDFAVMAVVCIGLWASVDRR